VVLSGVAMQNADDGYSRRGNFDGLLACNMFLMYRQMALALMVQEMESVRG